jgi:hypothetical protein
VATWYFWLRELGASAMRRYFRPTTAVLLVIGGAAVSAPSAIGTPARAQRGSSSAPTEYLKALNGLYATVSLSTSGLPAGVTATWSKTSLLVSGRTR